MENPQFPITDLNQFLEMVNAFRVSRIILSAVEVRVFDLLAGGARSSDEVSALLGTKPRATDRFLNAVVAVGLLHKADGVYSNTPFAEKHLVTTSPAYLDGLLHTIHLWRTWNTLTDVLYTGTSIVLEKPINERHEEWREAFIAAMHRRAGPQAVEVADALDLTHVKRVLDVGGGSGAFTMEFLNRNPEMTGVVFDLPNIVPLTKEYVTPPPAPPQKGRGDTHPSPLPTGTQGSIRHPGSGIRDRVSVIAGDYLKDDFGRGYDLVFMSAIIHINSPEENKHLVKKGAEALNPGGKLVVLDHIMSDDRTEPRAGALFAINMLVGTLHGDVYTESELRSWMAAAGLTDVTMVTTPSGVQLITGKRGGKEGQESR